MQTSHRSLPQRFPPALLASLVTAALIPNAANALDLATSPARVSPSAAGGTGYVVPNIIFSLDNSAFTQAQTIPLNGTNQSATAVMTSMLSSAIQDTATFPDGSFRFTWQTMTNGCQSDAKLTTMQELNTQSRSAFAQYLRKFDSCSWRTTSQRIPSNAYYYFEGPLTPKSPWAFKPGVQGEPYLGCRRNYHFIFSGNAYEENAADSPSNDGIRGWPNSKKAAGTITFPDGVKLLAPPLQGNSADQFRAYTSNAASAITGQLGKISEIAIASWLPLQYFPSIYSTELGPESDHTATAAGAAFPDPILISTGRFSTFQPAITLEGKLPLPADLTSAPDTETIRHRDGTTSVTLQKYWNPKYNPAIWPHMVTHTFGLGDKAIPRFAYKDSSNFYRDYRYPAVQPTELAPYGLDGDFVKYAKGDYGWRAQDTQYYLNQQFIATGNDSSSGTRSSIAADSAQDLWRAALVSRGNYYVVRSGDEVAHALKSVVAQSKADFGGSPGGTTGNSTTKTGTTGATSAGVLSGTATSGTTIARRSIELFKSYYQAGSAWKGWITGESLASNAQSTVATTGIQGWQGQNTAQRLDAQQPNNRVILGWRDANGSHPAGGVAFRWASTGQNLSPAHNSLLSSTDQQGQKRLNFLRGDRSAEGTAAPAFRGRQSVHGDVVNSQIWYTPPPLPYTGLPGDASFTTAQKSRIPMIYVGANDGMLHGFSAQDGSEKIAYVPRGVLPHLAALTSQGYTDAHRYFVDGSPMTGNVQMAAAGSTPDWRTVLVGTLGAGGKGYFVLDVTDPANFSEQERAAAGTVVMDKTLAEAEVPACVSNNTSCLNVDEADLGYITAAPVRDDKNYLRATQITLMNNDRWAVVMGNGYNSINQRPVLLVQYLDGAKELLRLPATGSTAKGAHANTTDNGLGAPRLGDLDADGRPDVAYAGDNKGNLWKFDLSSFDASRWGVAFEGEPLFIANGPDPAHDLRTAPQPITAAPIILANDRTKKVGSGNRQASEAVGGMMVVFGTGRNVDKADPADMSVQSLYGVLDNTRYAYGTGDPKRLAVQAGCTRCNDGKDIDAPAPVRMDLLNMARQSIGSQSLGGQSGRGFWAVEQSAEAGSPAVNWLTQKGWYLDFPVRGERLLRNIESYDGTNILAVYSQTLLTIQEQLCTSSPTQTAGGAERYFATLINGVDGAAPRVPLVDANGDGAYNAGDGNAARMDSQSPIASSIVTNAQQRVNIHGDGTVDKLARPPSVTLRPSWRHLQ